MNARFHEQAIAELREAVAYYDSRSEGLGDRLLAEIRSAVEFIEEHPSASAVISRGVRRKVLVKFPYQLFYVVDDRGISIVAVGHERRRPGYWRSRV